MATVASVDYPNKRIYLHADTVGVDLDTLDVYRGVRAFRRITEEHRKYDFMITGGGNEEKIAGATYTPAFVKLWYGCRIIPYDAAQNMKVIRDTFTDDGVAGLDCFDRSGLANNVNIDIDIQEVEIRTVATGSAVTAQDVVDITDSVWLAVLSNYAATVGSTGEALDGAGSGGVSASTFHGHMDTYLNKNDYKADVTGIAIDEADIHDALDSFTNKDDYKADVSDVHMADAEVHTALDSYTNKDDYKSTATSLDENDIHGALDSYINKDDYKATVTALDEADIHGALDSYTNKTMYQADISSLATFAQVGGLENASVTATVAGVWEYDRGAILLTEKYLNTENYTDMENYS